MNLLKRSKLSITLMVIGLTSLTACQSSPSHRIVEVEKECPFINSSLLKETAAPKWESGSIRDRLKWCEEISGRLKSCNADKACAVAEDSNRCMINNSGGWSSEK